MDWWAIPGYAIGVIGIAINFIRRSGAKEPVWGYKTINLIDLESKAPPQIKVTFGEKPVKNVYRTVLVIFNKGSETIRAEDVPENDKITFYFKGAEILSDPNRLTFEPSNLPFVASQIVKDGQNCVQIEFKYLKHSDGLALEIFHTESQSITSSGCVLDARYDGKVRNIGEFVPYKHLDLATRLKKRDTIFGIVLAVVFYGFFLYVAINTKNYGFLAFMVGTIVLLTVLPLLNHYRRNKFPEWTSEIEF